MIDLRKSLVGAAAAGAMALVSTPATARDRDRDDGIDVGDVIAGALIIGGIAAVASAASRNNNDRYYDRDNRGYRGYGDNRRYRDTGRRAVEQCVYAAQREAQRYGYRSARVTDIRDVDDRRSGWRVKGRIVVDGARGGYNYGDDRGYRDRYGYRDRDGYRDRYDYRDRNRYQSRDSGEFTCYSDRGRTQVQFSGIRGLR